MKKVALLILIGLSLATPLAAADSPKGTLFIIGGGDYPDAMMKRFIDLAERFQSGRIVVFPMASDEPAESGQRKVDEMKKLGAKNVEYHILTHAQAMAGGSDAILDNVGGVFFGGGDQALLTAALLDTPIHKKLLELYRQGAVIGGTSAGAAVMSEIMITGDERKHPGGEEEEAEKFTTIEAGNIITAQGFGFITSAIIDQHHVARKRLNRLICVVAEQRKLLGVGIDEATAIVVAPDDTFDVVGESCVLVFDPSRARVEIPDDKRIRVEDLTLHILTHGARYSLKDRKVVH
ncbi:MAG: cyanophycinase [Acidobacteriota bacterium]